MSNTRLKAILVAIVLTVNATMAQSVGLLRDPDIEHGLQKLANPILRAAGLNIGAVKVFIVNDMSLNAFVIDHNHILIHAGLVLKLQNADQLQFKSTSNVEGHRFIFNVKSKTMQISTAG